MFFRSLIDAVPLLAVQKLIIEQEDKIKQLNVIKGELDKMKFKQMYDASNTLQTPIFDTSNISFMDKAEHFFNATDKIIKLVTHPILIINGLAGVSFYVAAAVGLTGLIFYICGFKKGMKYTVGSVLGYFVIQVINWGANLL